jgi:hypothetical protein
VALYISAGVLDFSLLAWYVILRPGFAAVGRTDDKASRAGGKGMYARSSAAVFSGRRPSG